MEEEMSLVVPKITPDVYTDAELKEAFPSINPGHKPYGSRVIVQLRTARTKSKGGIIFTSTDQETEKWNTQVGKVRALGPLTFKDRKTLEPWPEGAWCKEGTFLRIPKWNQDKWEIQHGDFSVLFMLINDLDLLAEITCSPLEIKAYI